MMLLIAVMLMGAGNVWAEDVTGTITFGSNNVKINAASVTGNDSQNNTWTITTVGTTSFTSSSNYYQVGSGNKPATSITFTTTLSNDVNITAFSAKFGGFNNTAGTITLKVGDTTVGTGNLNGTSDVTVSNTSNATGKVLTVTVTDIAKGVKCYNISYTYTIGTSTPKCATPTFSPIAGTYTSAQNVTISTTTDGASIYYTTDGTAPTGESTKYIAPIAISETTTIKAIAVADGYDNSAVATATYTIQSPITIAEVRAQGTGSVLTQGIVTSCSGTTAYIQDATAAICVYGSTLTVGDMVTVQGTLSTYKGLLEITSPTVTVVSSGNSVTPTVKTIAEINSDYSGDNALQGMFVKIENATVTAVSGSNTTISQGENTIIVRGITDVTVAVGDVITLTGNIGCFDAAQIANPTNVIVSVMCATPTFSPAAGTYTYAQSVEISCATDGATVYYTTDGTEPSASNGTEYSGAIAVGSNMTIKAIAVKDGLENSAVVSAAYVIDLTPVITAANVELAYDATSGEIEYSVTNTVEGKTLSATTTAEWISDITVTADKVTFTTTANESETNRVATVTLSYEGAENVDVTVTQKHFVVDYAALPFTFDGKKAAIANTIGLTQSGLGSDYSSSPYLKFDSEGDYLILKINEAPGKLSFFINGNSFSGGTFKVQVSANGESYTDLVAYTTIGSNNLYDKEFDNLSADVRYIKWVYTKKVSGNVALGSISLKKLDLTPSITVNPTLIEATAADTEGTINVTYKNITDIIAEVYFCDAEGTAATYDWIDAEINSENNVDYVIETNEGEARTAYMKVYALDDNTDEVYSELITINQAAYVAPEVTIGNFVKVTSTDDITSGQYLIVYEDGGVAFDGSRNDSDDKLDAVGNTINVTIENDMIAATTTNAKSVFNIDVTAGTLQSASGKYIGVSGNSNGLKTSDDAETYIHTFSIDEEGNAVIAANFDGSSMTLRYNKASDNLRFRYYKSGQQSIQLYKFVADAADATVTVSDAGYATYCSENDLDFSNTAITAYKAVKTGSEVSFKEIKQVPAGEGVLLKADEGTYTVPVAAYAAANTDNAFIGVTENTEVAAGIYVLMAGTKTNQGTGFYKTTKTFTVGAHTAYLPAMEGGAEGNARSFIGFDFDGGTTTAIAQVEDGGMKMEGTVYNLQGQRVVKAQKGLYIVNGRLQVVK